MYNYSCSIAFEDAFDDDLLEDETLRDFEEELAEVEEGIEEIDEDFDDFDDEDFDED
jgi:hypothetical protein